MNKQIDIDTFLIQIRIERLVKIKIYGVELYFLLKENRTFNSDSDVIRTLKSSIETVVIMYVR